MNCFKKLLKRIWYVILSLIICLLLVLVFSVLFCSVIFPFSLFVVNINGGDPNNLGFLLSTLGSSLILGIATFIILAIGPLKGNKLGNYLGDHISQFISFIVIVSLFTISFSSMEHIDFGTIETLLNIMWVVFSVSLAIYLFKIESISQTMKEKQDASPPKLFGDERIKELRLIKMIKDENDAIQINVVFIIINVISLILFTGIYFLFGPEKYPKFTSYMYCVVLYSTTNTLIQVLLDVVSSFYRKKKIFYDNVNTKKEFNMEKEIIKASVDKALYKVGCDKIDKEQIDEGEKDKKKKELMESLMKEHQE